MKPEFWLAGLIAACSANVAWGITPLSSSTKEAAKKSKLNNKLFSKAQSPDVNPIQELVELGADVNARTSDGWSVLSLAAASGQLENVRWLLSHGADPSVLNDDGKSVADVACSGEGDVPACPRGEIRAAFAEAGSRAQKLRGRGQCPVPQDDEDSFQKALRDYKSGTAKLKLPQDAHKFEVQAKFAVEQKRFEDAAARYADALRAAPWWPQGRYNRAIILAKLSCYEEAILEMKRRVLVPDAPDSRKAQDMIYWESGLSD